MTDKILSQSSFFYPIREVTATFRYRKVGTPTVFDELVMGLANDFPQLASNSLGQIAKMMQLDPIFLQYTLNSMVDLGVLERSYFDEKLENITLSELKLTTLGKDFYRKKQMPGRHTRKSESYFFTPLSPAYEKSLKTSGWDENFTLSESLFPLNEDMLQVLSLDAVKNLAWFTADVELEPDGISHEFGQTQWQGVKVKLSLDINRHLQISSEDKLFGKWLSERSAGVIREHLLNPLLVKAENEITIDVEIKYDVNELRSFVLADQLSDLSAVKNAIAVKFSDNQEINEKSPAVIFDAFLDEATLNGMHLTIPFEGGYPDDGTSQLFFQFQNRKIFIELKGYLHTYFDHQPKNLPVKILAELESDWIQDLPAFQQPNQATLVFMANFISEADLVTKLPTMKIVEAENFHQCIQQAWGKAFAPQKWIEKISSLANEEELAIFTKLFPKVPLHLSQFTENIHGKLLDNAFENPNAKVGKILEFADMLRVAQALQKLDTGKIQLNSVNVETLTKIQEWQESYADFGRRFPTAFHSSSVLAKKSELLTSWQLRVCELFEPLLANQKYAVLDTNFVINQPQKLADIKLQRTVILPKTVTYELDKLKKNNKNELAEKQNNLDKFRSIIETEQLEMGKLTQQIKLINEKLEDQDNLSETEIKTLKAEKNDLGMKKQGVLNNLKKNEKDHSNLNQEIRQLEGKIYKIRDASRIIDELKISEYSEEENPVILAMIIGQEQCVADDKILAVVARYKLNDVLFYTEDKILKSKATSIGIKAA